MYSSYLPCLLILYPNHLILEHTLPYPYHYSFSILALMLLQLYIYPPVRSPNLLHFPGPPTLMTFPHTHAAALAFWVIQPRLLILLWFCASYEVYTPIQCNCMPLSFPIVCPYPVQLCALILFHCISYPVQLHCLILSNCKPLSCLTLCPYPVHL